MNKLARLLPLLLFGLLLGCGSPGEKQEEPAFPRPQPGANPASLPQTPLRFINQSGAINGADFQQAVAAIDLQIRGDLNPRWGINGVAIAYFGPQDPDIPSVILRDDTGIGGFRLPQPSRFFWSLARLAWRACARPAAQAGLPVAFNSE